MNRVLSFSLFLFLLFTSMSASAGTYRGYSICKPQSNCFGDFDIAQFEWAKVIVRATLFENNIGPMQAGDNFLVCKYPHFFHSQANPCRPWYVVNPPIAFETAPIYFTGQTPGGPKLVPLTVPSGGTCSVVEPITLTMPLSSTVETTTAQSCSIPLTRTETIENEDTVFVMEEWAVVVHETSASLPTQISSVSATNLWSGKIESSAPRTQIKYASSSEFASGKIGCLLNGAAFAEQVAGEGDALLIVDHALHPPDNRFMPYPTVEIFPKGRRLKADNVVNGFVRVDVSKSEEIRAVDILYADAPLPVNLADVIKAGLVVDYIDDRRHRFFVYGHFRLESGTVRLIKQAITLPQCCGPPQDLK